MTASPDVPEVYDRYMTLSKMAESDSSRTLAGKFLLVPGFGPDAPALIFAAGIASAVSLLLESDPVRIQEANRLRACEFIVNTLDEAIRVLKNQLRKRQPVAVLLKTNPALAFNEMLDRGLQPDLLAVDNDPAVDSLIAQFLSRGGRALKSFGRLDPERQQHQEVLMDVRWRIVEAPGIWLPKIDALFESLLPNDPRRQWIRAAPLYLDRALQFERYVRLDGDEAARFLAMLKHNIASGAIGAPLYLKIGEEPEQRL